MDYNCYCILYERSKPRGVFFKVDVTRVLYIHTAKIEGKALVSRGQTLVSRRGVIAFSISAPRERVWECSQCSLGSGPTDFVGR